MPGKKGRKSTKADASAIRAIWGQIDISDWYNIAKQAHPNSDWVYQRQTIKGKCPFHDDKSPSFYIDLGKKHAKCFGADCGKYFWDPVRFYMAMSGQGMHYHKALLDMKNRFGIQFSQKLIAEVGKTQKHREMKKLLFQLMQGELIDCYADRNSKAPNQDLLYARDALAYLDKRGIPPVYHCLPVGVYPPALRLETLVKQRLPMLGKHMSKVWDDIVEYLDLQNRNPNWVGSLVFFTGASPQDVARLKLRRVPPRNAPEHPMFAHDKQDDDKIMMFLPDEHENQNGIFGLFGTGPYYTLMGGKGAKPFHYMEGEVDALCCMAAQFQTGSYDFFAFSGGGASAQGLDCMVNYGFDMGYVVGDFDKGGKGFIQRVLESTVKLPTRVFVWPEVLTDDGQNDTLPKTDPADAVKRLGYDKVRDELRKEENFVKPYQWAFSQAKLEMNGIEPDDIRHLTAVAANWGAFVRDTAEQHAYVKDISDEFSISGGQVLSEIKSGEETEEAFIERIREYLANRLHLLQRTQSLNACVLRVYDTRSREIYEMSIEEKTKIAATLGAMTGKDLLQFIREDVGEPSFLEVDDDAGEQVYIKLSNRCADYVKTAVTRLSRGAVNNRMIRQLGAGVHCVAPDADNPNETFRLYHVNGLQLLRGEFDTTGRLVWKDLPGPSDSSVVVHTDGSNYPTVYAPHVMCANDLNVTPAYTPGELYDLVYNMLDVGWDFKHHEVTCHFLTAFCLGIPVANCVGRQPLVMVTSEHASGKSSLIGGFIGRRNLPAINIIQAREFSDDYTVAGIRQLMNNSSLCLCLDEFEDKGSGDRRSAIIRGLLQLFRGHSNEEGRTVIGSASGQHREFRFHSPAIVAGIRGLREAVDISRFIVIEMDRKALRTPPDALLLEQFGEETLRKVRLNLPLVMYQKAKEFHEVYKKIAKEYRNGGGLKHGQLARSRTHLYSPMAVMAVCGKDYRKFIKDYFDSHAHTLERLATLSLSSDLLETLLHTPKVAVPDLEERRPKTLSAVLSGGNPELLNQSDSGIYYDWKTQWIAVHWPSVIGNDFFHTPEFRDRDTGWLKQTAARNEYHVADNEVNASGIFQRLSSYMGKATFRSGVSVFNVSALMTKAEISRQMPVRSRKGMEKFSFAEEYEKRLAQYEFPPPPDPACLKEIPDTVPFPEDFDGRPPPFPKGFPRPKSGASCGTSQSTPNPSLNEPDVDELNWEV